MNGLNLAAEGPELNMVPPLAGDLIEQPIQLPIPENNIAKQTNRNDMLLSHDDIDLALYSEEEDTPPPRHDTPSPRDHSQNQNLVRGDEADDAGGDDTPFYKLTEIYHTLVTPEIAAFFKRDTPALDRVVELIVGSLGVTSMDALLDTPSNVRLRHGVPVTLNTWLRSRMTGGAGSGLRRPSLFRDDITPTNTQTKSFAEMMNSPASTTSASAGGGGGGGSTPLSPSSLRIINCPLAPPKFNANPHLRPQHQISQPYNLEPHSLESHGPEPHSPRGSRLVNLENIERGDSPSTYSLEKNMVAKRASTISTIPPPSIPLEQSLWRSNSSLQLSSLMMLDFLKCGLKKEAMVPLLNLIIVKAQIKHTSLLHVLTDEDLDFLVDDVYKIEGLSDETISSMVYYVRTHMRHLSYSNSILITDVLHVFDIDTTRFRSTLPFSFLDELSTLTRGELKRELAEYPLGIYLVLRRFLRDAPDIFNSPMKNFNDKPPNLELEECIGIRELIESVGLKYGHSAKEIASVQKILIEDNWIDDVNTLRAVDEFADIPISRSFMSDMMVALEDPVILRYTKVVYLSNQWDYTYEQRKQAQIFINNSIEKLNKQLNSRTLAATVFQSFVRLFEHLLLTPSDPSKRVIKKDNAVYQRASEFSASVDLITAVGYKDYKSVFLLPVLYVDRVEYAHKSLAQECAVLKKDTMQTLRSPMLHRSKTNIISGVKSMFSIR